MDRRELLKGATALGALGPAGCVTAPAPEPDMEAAFFYGYTLFEFVRIMQAGARGEGRWGGAANTIVHIASLADHTMRDVPGPNNDTVYSNAFLDLSSGPVEVSIPTDRSRYFSVAFLDAFTDNIAIIGTRTTGGAGGRYWVAGPNWRGAIPRDAKLVRLNTNDAWIFSRVLVNDAEDLAAARRLQEQVRVRATVPAPPRPFVHRATSMQDAESFLGVVNEMLARSRGGGGHVARASRFASFGMGTDDKPSNGLLDAWQGWLADAPAKLIGAFRGSFEAIDGWAYSPPSVGKFGLADRIRAGAAFSGIGILVPEEAMYMAAVADASRDPLIGDRPYRWRVPPGGIPVEAFWSLTMYQVEADGRLFLVDNPIRRYSIGDRTKGLVKNSDGSIDIMLQREQPAGALAANWLPTPAGPMRPILRAYIPKRDLLEGKWRLPPIERVA